MSEELNAIRERHEADDQNSYQWDGTPAGLAAHYDRATLLSALSAAEARAEAAEARAENLDALVDARHDLAYANGFRAGWNAGVAYEQCQPVPFERKASGNPEYHLQTLATMDRRSADALAILAARTLKRDTE